MRISDWSSDVCSSDLYGNAILAVIALKYQKEPKPLAMAIYNCADPIDSSSNLWLGHYKGVPLMIDRKFNRQNEIVNFTDLVFSLIPKLCAATKGDRKSTRLNSSH